MLWLSLKLIWNNMYGKKHYYKCIWLDDFIHLLSDIHQLLLVPAVRYLNVLQSSVSNNCGLDLNTHLEVYFKIVCIEILSLYIILSVILTEKFRFCSVDVLLP